MQLRVMPRGLLAKAERGQPLPPVFVVASDEPLLALESAGRHPCRGRRAGLHEREVLQADGRFDWSRLTEAAGGLCCSRPEDRRDPAAAASGQRGAAPRSPRGARANRLATAAGRSSPCRDSIAVARRRAGWLRWSARRAGRDRFDRPRAAAQWIGERLARQQQRRRRGALSSSRARRRQPPCRHQEIAKLGCSSAGELTLAQVTDSVLNVARYDSSSAARDARRRCRARAQDDGRARSRSEAVRWCCGDHRGTAHAIGSRAGAVRRPFSDGRRDNRCGARANGSSNACCAAA